MHPTLHSLSADRCSLRTLHARTRLSRWCCAVCCVACTASVAVACGPSGAPRAGLLGPLTGIAVPAPGAQQFQGAAQHLFAHGQQVAGAEQGVVGIVELDGTPPEVGVRAVLIVVGIFSTAWSTASCRTAARRLAAMPFGSLQWTMLGSCACVWAKLYVPLVLWSVRDVLIVIGVAIGPSCAAANQHSRAVQQRPVFSQGEGPQRGSGGRCQQDGCSGWSGSTSRTSWRQGTGAAEGRGVAHGGRAVAHPTACTCCIFIQCGPARRWRCGCTALGQAMRLGVQQDAVGHVSPSVIVLPGGSSL